MKKIVLLAGLVFCFAFTGFASAEYIDNEDGSITDTTTNLMWQKSYGAGSWDTANNYCTQSGTGGYYDWRLPTLTELQVLVDPAYEPTIDPIFACDLGHYYWTSSVDGGSAWAVGFTNGGAALIGKSSGQYNKARCVRGNTVVENCATLENNLDISIPCLDYNGIQYIVKLKYYINQSLPEGFYWEFESIQIK